MKNKYPELTKKLLSKNVSIFYISSITVFELVYGAEKGNWSNKTREKLAMFLAPFNILPFTNEDASTAGKIRGYLEKQGKPIGPYDVQIAAQGLQRNLTIVTHNIDEFTRVPNLKIEDWVA